MQAHTREGANTKSRVWLLLGACTSATPAEKTHPRFQLQCTIETVLPLCLLTTHYSLLASLHNPVGMSSKQQHRHRLHSRINSHPHTVSQLTLASMNNPARHSEHLHHPAKLLRAVACFIINPLHMELCRQLQLRSVIGPTACPGVCGKHPH